MSSPVIRVENLSKLYRLGEVGTGSLQHDVNRWWHLVRGKEDPYALVGQVNDRTRRRETGDTNTPSPVPRSPSPGSSDYVWALRDINFSVHQGEVLGIIGSNGAGKSTLLKILSRVTGPTTGSAKVKGRIASLLEVGTGFHPELTGRENIYLNGAILGMRKREIDGKLDEIVEFSGCAAYLDTPVKRYSSGMTVRLAFAVAAHLEPEILVVDEVLAVGDAQFQKKCLGKMGEIAKGGRTILFVSHNLTAVRSLCSRAVLLRDGQLSVDGATNDVLQIYQSEDFREAVRRTWEFPEGARLHLTEARIDLEDPADESLRVDTPFTVSFCVRSNEETMINLSPHYLGMGGEVIFAAPSPVRRLRIGDNWFHCRIPGHFLNDGVYSVQLLIVSDSSSVIAAINETLVFEIHDLPRSGAWHGKWPGVVRPNLEWTFGQSSTRFPSVEPIPVLA